MSDAAWDFAAALMNLAPAFRNGGPEGWVKYRDGFPNVAGIDNETVKAITEFAAEVARTGERLLEARRVGE